MKAPLTILLIALTSGVALGDAEGGGLSGVLGGVGVKPEPDHADRSERQGIGRPDAPGGRRPVVAPAAPRKLDLDERIKQLRREIAEMKKVTAATVKPIDGVAEATGRVGRLRAALDKAREDITAADRAEAAQLARAKTEFDKKWAKHTKAVEAGEKPADVSPLEWAGMCDDYFAEQAELSARFAAAKRRLKSETDRRVAALARAVKEAREHLDRTKKARGAMSPGSRKFMARMMGWKAHKVALRGAEHLLDELLRLQADLKGSGKSRQDPIEAETIEQSGFMLSDALRRLVLREFALSDAKPYPSPGDLDKGLSLPSWMKPLTPLDRQKAKCKYAQEQLRLAREGLARLDDEVKAEDDARVTFLRQLGLSDAELKAEADKLAASHGKRRGERLAELSKSAEYWKKQVQIESDRLAKMVGAASTRPAPGP